MLSACRVVIVGLLFGAQAAKPVDQMTSSELFHAAKVITADLSKQPLVAAKVHELDHILDSIAKHVPAHGHLEHASAVEQSVDSVVHAAFHPIETAEQELAGGWWDLRHPTAPDSAWILLRGIFVLACLYVCVGMWVMRAHFNASGLESVPHLSFWMSYPGLVSDGVYFVLSKMGLAGSSSNAEKSDSFSLNTFSQFQPI